MVRRQGSIRPASYDFAKGGCDPEALDAAVWTRENPEVGGFYWLVKQRQGPDDCEDLPALCVGRFMQLPSRLRDNHHELCLYDGTSLDLAEMDYLGAAWADMVGEGWWRSKDRITPPAMWYPYSEI
jgi:hypothetical protein